MRKTLKQTITAILAAAILITGISPGGTITAHAATTVENFNQNGEATMKPGDVKKLLVMDKSGKDLVETYKWSSSDSSVLKVESDFVDDSVDFTCCVYVTALKNGTATITGKSIYGYQSLTMTVSVQLAKATAKQKKCKHTWKTTKKATCERTGIKTCKKCKLQESIAKKEHSYVKKNVAVTMPEYYVTVRECRCGCGKTFKTDKVPNYYGFKFATDKSYGEAYTKMLREIDIAHGGDGSNINLGGSYVEWEDQIGQQTVMIEKYICKYCMNSRDEIEAKK